MYTKRILPLMLALSLVSSAAPVFAEEIHTTTTPPIVSPAPVIDIVCIAAVVDKRELAVAAAFDAYATSQKIALSARRTALANAWKMTERKERNAAILAAWKTYRTDHRAAVLTHRKAIEAAWKQAKTDWKACAGGKEARVESHGAIEDILGIPAGIK